MRAAAAIAGLVALCAASRGVRAEPPPLDHVVAAPTAWLPRAGTLVAWGGLDHRGDGSVDLGVGLGDIAAVDIDVDHELRACNACDPSKPPPAVALGRAGFRIGARQDTWFAGQPAVVLGWRATFAGARGARASDMYAVASRVIGGLRLHAGVDAMDARGDDHASAPALGATVRPTLGAELTVAQYPRTSLIGDLVWVPRLDPTKPGVEALGDWGVRYQSTSWAGVELVVRDRGGEGIADATVRARVYGVWGR
jgi:hypothetical protein